MHYLYFGPVYVGDIEDVFEHQGTWFGQFQLLDDRARDGDSDRILGFIEFCSDWYSKQKGDNPPDASQFDAFAELIGEGLWTVRDDGDNTMSIVDAPMFLDGRRGEMCWVQPAQQEAR